MIAGILPKASAFSMNIVLRPRQYFVYSKRLQNFQKESHTDSFIVIDLKVLDTVRSILLFLVKMFGVPF